MRCDACAHARKPLLLQATRALPFLLLAMLGEATSADHDGDAVTSADVHGAAATFAATFSAGQQQKLLLLLTMLGAVPFTAAHGGRSPLCHWPRRRCYFCCCTSAAAGHGASATSAVSHGGRSHFCC